MLKVIPNPQLFLFLIALSFIILLLDLFGALKIVKSAAFFITNPISFGIYQAKQTSLKQFYFIFAARSAARENKALQEQLGQILSENASLRRKLAETESMVIQQKKLDPRIYNLLSAHPIGLDRFLKIDQGTQKGVKIGQVVVFQDNLIGSVVKVAENGASVRLLADPDSKIGAFSFGKAGKAKGILVGQFGTESLMDKILHEEQIEKGDLVYSEGTEGNIPRGLILGRVMEVLEKDNEIFKQARIAPIFNISDVELVFVILD